MKEGDRRSGDGRPDTQTDRQTERQTVRQTENIETQNDEGVFDSGGRLEKPQNFGG